MLDSKSYCAFAAAHPIIFGAILGAVIGAADAAINGRNVLKGAAMGAIGGAIGGAIIGPSLNFVGGFIDKTIGPAILRIASAGYGMYSDIQNQNWFSLGVTSVGVFGELNNLENMGTSTDKITEQELLKIQKMENNGMTLENVGVDEYKITGGEFSKGTFGRKESVFKKIFTQSGMHHKNQRVKLVHYTENKKDSFWGRLWGQSDGQGFHLDAYDAANVTGFAGHQFDVVQGLVTRTNVSRQNSLLYNSSNSQSVKNFMLKPRL